MKRFARTETLCRALTGVAVTLSGFARALHFGGRAPIPVPVPVLTQRSGCDRCKGRYNYPEDIRAPKRGHFQWRL